MIELTIAAEDPVQLLAKLQAAVQCWSGKPAEPPKKEERETVVAYVPPKETNGHTSTAKVTTGKITAVMLREALAKYLEKHDEADTLKLLRKIGKSTNVSGVDPVRYQAVYDAFTAE